MVVNIVIVSSLAGEAHLNSTIVTALTFLDWVVVENNCCIASWLSYIKYKLTKNDLYIDQQELSSLA